MIYLDNAATTRPNQRAVARAQKFLQDEFYNPSALYRGGFTVSGEIKKSREFLLSTIANSTDYDLIFTSCGTEADNQAIFGSVKRGNFVLTEGEHSAVYSCAQELKNRGMEVRFAPLLRDGSVDVEKLVSLIDGQTSLVSVIHVNNETGAINDVNAIGKLIKAKNPRALYHVDGVQAFGKIPFRLDGKIDFYAVSAHKIGGLKGTGALFKKKSTNLSPFLFGGGQENGKRSGTENVFGITQFAYSAEEKFQSLVADEKRMSEYRERLWNMLDKTLFERLSGEDGTPYILTLSAVGLRGEVLQRMLCDNGLVVGTGSACSSKHRFSRVMTACGHEERVLDGVLRVSFSPENRIEEVEESAKILNATAGELRERMK